MRHTHPGWSNTASCRVFSLDPIRRLRGQRVAPLVILAMALVAVVWPAFAHAVEVWSTDEEFTYGFLIPPIAAFILWWRREALRRSIGQGRSAGIAIVLGSMAVMLIGHRIGINV